MKTAFYFKDQEWYVRGTKDDGSSDAKINDLIRETPCYFYHIDHVIERYKYLKDLLGDQADIFYAMKANSNPTLLKSIFKAGAGVDIVSGGELSLAVDCGVNPQKIIFSGVGKTKLELQKAIDHQIGCLFCESVPELTRAKNLAEQSQKTLNIGLRLNLDVEAGEHAYIRTGGLDHKFGISKEQIKEAKDLIKDSRFLNLISLSVHIGSQIQDIGDFETTLDRLLSFLDLESIDSLQSINFGGGLWVDYKNQEDDFGWLKKYGNFIKQASESLETKIWIEPGRWLVARAGLLISDVEYVKPTSGGPTFLILNTGMHHLIRPALYQAYHRVDALKHNSNDKKIYDVVGPICESSDVFQKAWPMPVMQEGERVVIFDAGAYGKAMASQYNTRDLPKELCWLDNQAHV